VSSAALQQAEAQVREKTLFPEYCIEVEPEVFGEEDQQELQKIMETANIWEDAGTILLFQRLLIIAYQHMFFSLNSNGGRGGRGGRCEANSSGLPQSLGLRSPRSDVHQLLDQSGERWS